MSRRARLILAPLAWALWAAAMLWRLRDALDRRDAGPSWWLLGLAVGVLGLYVAFRLWTLWADTEWLYGWRR